MEYRVGEQHRIWIVCHLVAVRGAMWSVAVIPVTNDFGVWAIVVVTPGTPGGFSGLYCFP